MKKTLIELRVNEETHEVFVTPQRTLLDVLREDLGFTGTKDSCGLGNCGACTVLINGKAALSCVMLARSAEGKEITTIEELAQRPIASPAAGVPRPRGRPMRLLQPWYDSLGQVVTG